MVAPAVAHRIRVVIVDDHPVALAGIRVGLKRFHDIHLEAEALDGGTGLERIAELLPDVAIVDVQLPDIDGLEVTARARDSSPATRIIITSGDLSIATMSRASQLGVAGFFHKSGAVERLALLIRSVYHEGPDESDSLTVPDPQTTAGLDALTPKEHELLMLVANGVSLKQTAERMGITHSSADRLERVVMLKLGVDNRVDLIGFAVREQLVHDPL
jgi:DNA-binding NarL/FixJ family response regulator